MPIAASWSNVLFPVTPVEHSDQLRRSTLAGAVSCILLFYGLLILD